MGGEVDVLGEVKTVKEGEKVRSEGRVWKVNVDVEVASEQEAVGERRGDGEEFREFREKRGVCLRGAVE